VADPDEAFGVPSNCRIVEPILWLPAAFMVASDGSLPIGPGCVVDWPALGAADRAGAGACVARVDALGAGAGVADVAGLADGAGAVGAGVATGAGVLAVTVFACAEAAVAADALCGWAVPVATPAMRASTAVATMAKRRGGRIGKPFETSVVGGRRRPTCQCWGAFGRLVAPPR
jgi:hypothetical protein